MAKPVLILALLAAAYVAYTEFAPENARRALVPSDGRVTPAGAGIVNGGTTDAARGISP